MSQYLRRCLGVLAVPIVLVVGPDSLRAQELENELLRQTDHAGAVTAVAWYEEGPADSLSDPRHEQQEGPILAVANRLLGQGRLADALEFAHLAANRYPESVEAQFVHAEAHRLRGDMREIDPVYGLMLLRLTRRDGAAAAERRFGEIRRLDLSNGEVVELSPAALDIAVVSLLGDQDLEAALSLARLNAREHASSARAHETLGDVLLARGDTVGAVAAYRTAGLSTSPINKLTELGASPPKNGR